MLEMELPVIQVKLQVVTDLCEVISFVPGHRCLCESEHTKDGFASILLCALQSCFDARFNHFMTLNV